MSERKLATIQKIEEIKPIEGADKICAYRVKGWWVVDQIDKYKVGDYVCYVEIDSWIPTEVASFLSKGKEPREYLGVKGEKLKTIKLRNTLSQGLILNIKDIFNTIMLDNNEYLVLKPDAHICIQDLYINQTNLSELLGIIKWEAPETNNSGQRKGNFPSYISKTDQERVQNIWNKLKEKYNEVEWEVTLKLDGTSFTAYYNEGQFGVCSRNMELQESEDSKYWKVADEYELRRKLKSHGKNIAIQGELCGEGTQGNPENIKGYRLFIFDIYDIDKGTYQSPEERHQTINSLNDGDYNSPTGIEQIPIFYNNNFFNYTDFGTEITKPIYKLSQFETLEDILKFAEGRSLRSDCREGLVFKSLEHIDGEIKSFKVISNLFLLKSDS